jgi:hypothetical protein
MTSHTHVHLTGTVSVGLAPSDAFELFTPSGERRWATGWDPLFPAAPADETTPGTVFQTRHSGPATWVVVDSEPGRSITYANVSENDRAGLVRVSCEPAHDGMTTANVTYDMTALSDDGDTRLRQFAAHYPEFLSHWQRAIDDALSALFRPTSVSEPPDGS